MGEPILREPEALVRQDGPPSTFGGMEQLPRWAREGEAFDLTLRLHGQYAGMQSWHIRPEKGAVTVRVQTDFGGTLPKLRLHQTSRLHPRTLALLSYTEGEGSRRSGLELTLDHRAGEVRLRQRGEEVSGPLVTDYLDPISLLLWLREWQAEPHEQRRLRLLGGPVYAQRLPDELLEDGRPAEVLLLRPGGAGVWRGTGPARPFLRLSQPTPFGTVEAVAGAIHPR